MFADDLNPIYWGLKKYLEKVFHSSSYVLHPLSPLGCEGHEVASVLYQLAYSVLVAPSLKHPHGLKGKKKEIRFPVSKPHSNGSIAPKAWHHRHIQTMK